MDEIEKTILTTARRLEILEKEYLKYSYESKKPENEEELENFLMKSIQLAQEAYTIKNEIKLELSKITDLAVHDPQVIRTIDKIKNNKKFYSISFYENIAEMLNKNIENLNEQFGISTREFLMSEKYDELFGDFHTWFDVCSYYSDKMEIGAIISSAIVPRKILPYFNEIRETYAFGQLRASIALCRALLEMVLYDKLDRMGAFKNKATEPPGISPEKEGNLYRYILDAKRRKVLSNDEAYTAHKVKNFCNQILHLKNENVAPKLSETYRTIVDTISVIESIYRN